LAGRYGMFAGLVPVAANLHHGVEMLLKGALSKTMTLEDLKLQLRHNLPKIWKKFKKQANDESLHGFDRVLKALSKFDEPSVRVSAGFRVEHGVAAGQRTLSVVTTGNGCTAPVRHSRFRPQPIKPPWHMSHDGVAIQKGPSPLIALATRLVAKTPSGWPLYPEENRDRKTEYNQHVHCEVEG